MRSYATIEQESERLHMSRTKLYALVKAHVIPARRVGGIRAPLLFIPEEVDEALDRAAGIDKPHISEPDQGT